MTKKDTVMVRVSKKARAALNARVKKEKRPVNQVLDAILGV